MREFNAQKDKNFDPHGQKLLKRSEKKLNNTAKRLNRASDRGFEISIILLRSKLAKLAYKHSLLLKKYETNGRNVSFQPFLTSDGYDIEFYVEKPLEGLSEKENERIFGKVVPYKKIQLVDEPTKEQRCKSGKEKA